LPGARRGRREGVEMQRQLHLVDRLPERLPTRMPHRLHVPRARQLEALQSHLGDAMDLRHRALDAAIRQTGEADLAVRVVAAEILPPGFIPEWIRTCQEISGSTFDRVWLEFTTLLGYHML